MSVTMKQQHASLQVFDLVQLDDVDAFVDQLNEQPYLINIRDGVREMYSVHCN